MADFKFPQQVEIKKFTIVYDKSTEEVANSLFNLSSEKSISCACWSEKQYLDEKPRFTNENKVFFWAKEQAKKNLSSPLAKKKRITKYVELVTQANCAGLRILEIPTYNEAREELTSLLKKIANSEVPDEIKGNIAVTTCNVFGLAGAAGGVGLAGAAGLLWVVNVFPGIIGIGAIGYAFQQIRKKKEAKKMILHTASIEFFINHLDTFISNGK